MRSSWYRAWNRSLGLCGGYVSADVDQGIKRTSVTGPLMQVIWADVMVVCVMGDFGVPEDGTDEDDKSCGRRDRQRTKMLVPESSYSRHYCWNVKWATAWMYV